MLNEELSESILGTKEYWEQKYEEEITNFKDHGDVGEIWFGDDIGKRIVKWLNKATTIKRNSRIIDVGCGNGMLLAELFKCGFENLEGVDYSPAAIQLAREISQKKLMNIKFQEADILKSNFGNNQFDVVLDKGTYDAISLSSSAKENRTMYINNIYNCLKEDGFLIITTCNWTKDEIQHHFHCQFNVVDVIPTPQFKFGGNTGSTVVLIIFQKMKL